MSTTSSSGSSVALETLIGFCAAHPVPDTDASRFLTRLASGPPAIVDWRDRGVVAALLDGVVGPNGVVPFEIVGLAGGRLSAMLAEDLLREVADRARLLGSRASQLAMTAIWQPHLALATGLGYHSAYADCEMICRNADWGEDAELPAGAQWHEVRPDWVDEYIRILNDGFARSPGAFVPRPEEVRRYLQQPGIRARILVEDGRGIGILRFTEPDSYINAVARAADEKGRGIGRLIMDEARRCLVRNGRQAGPMTLTVVDTNTAAIELYRRCGFEVDRKVAVLIRHL